MKRKINPQINHSADNGLLTGRTNPFRSLSIDTRDSVGRITQETNTVNGAAALTETMTWRANSTLNSYSIARADGWNESRPYSYNSRGQLLSDGFSAKAGISSALNYAFDGTNPGLGVRTDAKIDHGSPASWEITSSANGFGRVTSDNQLTTSGHAFSASGSASNANYVEILVDGLDQGRAAYSGSSWSLNLNLAAGSHTLTANAVDSSGLYTASASSSFTVTAGNPNEQAGTVTSVYDDDGNVISRAWANGTTQTLTWDAQNHPIKISQRDSSNNGYDWSAIYDGLGRRLSTSQQPITNNQPFGAATIVASEYDPLVEFLEIGVSVNGAKSWEVRGIDANERYGGLQGTGGLEATVLDSDGTTKGVLNDFFGNVLGTVNGSSISWLTTKTGAYGPLPGNTAEVLIDITRVAEASVWRGHRLDPTGLYYLGARYYDPSSGRFLSADPLGHTASPSLYSFCNDPVNFFDPDGRCIDNYINRDYVTRDDPWQEYVNYGRLRGPYVQNGVDPNYVLWLNKQGQATGYYGPNGWVTVDSDNWSRFLETVAKINDITGESAAVVGGLAGKTTVGWFSDGLKFYPNGWAGNQWGSTLSIETAAKGLGYFGFGLGTTIDFYQTIKGRESKWEAGSNISVGVVTTFILGFPEDVIVGAAYVGAKANIEANIHHPEYGEATWRAMSEIPRD